MVRNYAERQAINAPIQGTAADIIKRAMSKFYIKNNAKLLNNCKLLLQVHDELVFEVENNHIDTVKHKVAKIMENAHLPHLNISVPLEVTIGIGDNWEAAH